MKIGKVISVEYDKFKVKLYHTTKNSAITLNGQIYYFGNIGSYLKTHNAIGDAILCEVVAILDHNIESKMYSNYNLDSSRELVIKPIGTLDKKGDFKLGIGIFPSIYADVSIVTFDDIKSILSPSKSGGEDHKIHREIELGISKNLINYKINLNINALFNIHTAVLGNSGSGKSNTIAHILQQVYQKLQHQALGAKTILFDVNGEYHRAFNDVLVNQLKTKFYKPNITATEDEIYTPFHLPYYLMNLDEWLAFLMASDRTQKPFWDSVLQETFKFYKIFTSNDGNESALYENYFKWKIRNILLNIVTQSDSDTIKITAARGVIIKAKTLITDLENNQNLIEFLTNADDSCTINFGNNDNKLIEFLSHIVLDEHNALEIDSKRLKPGDYFDHRFLKIAVDLTLLNEESKGNGRIREFTSTMINRLDYFLEHPDCDFMKQDDVNYLNESDYLKAVFSLDNKENQLIIIDTSEVGNDILELTTSVVNRMIFDFRKKKVGEDRRRNPIHIILDEAHRYIRKDVEYILRENIFERIAREGRKFAMYLIVSSQRPSELSATVLSQCGNYFIHRIQNEVDMRHIYSVLPYFSDDYVIKIKQAVPGEVLVFGNCVPMPLQIKIHKAVPEPNSENCIINEEWFVEKEIDNSLFDKDV